MPFENLVLNRCSVDCWIPIFQRYHEVLRFGNNLLMLLWIRWSTHCDYMISQDWHFCAYLWVKQKLQRACPKVDCYGSRECSGRLFAKKREMNEPGLYRGSRGTRVPEKGGWCQGGNRKGVGGKDSFNWIGNSRISISCFLKDIDPLFKISRIY